MERKKLKYFLLIIFIVILNNVLNKLICNHSKNHNKLVLLGVFLFLIYFKTKGVDYYVYSQINLVYVSNPLGIKKKCGGDLHN